MEKIAVLTTSEIFRSWYPKIGLPVMAEIETGDGRKAKFSSTGSIEKALEDGYAVYVVSTRSSLDTHDDWWTTLVNKDNIFLADAKYEGEFGEAWRYEDENVDKSNSGWKNLYEHLGHEYPTDEDGPVHWNTARMMLKHRHGVRLGTDFQVKSPRQLELLKIMKPAETTNDD